MAQPLAPPPDYTTVSLSPAIHSSSTTHIEQDTSPATPTSNLNMVLDVDGSATDRELEEDLDSDADMSEGGAAISSLSPSHAAALNAEMDFLDAEIMGEENFNALHNPNHNPQTHDDMEWQLVPFAFDIPAGVGPGEDWAVSTFDPPNPPAPHDITLHLEHLQTLDHMDAELTGNDEDDAPTNHSTVPFSNTTPVSQLHFSYGIDVAAEHAMQMGGAALLAFLNAPTPTTLIVDGTTGNGSDADDDEVEREPHNLDLGDFLYTWAREAAAEDALKRRARPHGPKLPEILNQRRAILEPVEESDLQGELCDIQRLNWKELGVTRLEARTRRRMTYKNYVNIRANSYFRHHPRLQNTRLPNDDSFFKFRRMDFDVDIYLAHFQLRNLIHCASRDHVFYTSRSKIMDFNPRVGKDHSKHSSVAMDLSLPAVPGPDSDIEFVQMSTMTVGHDILVAGGFGGEYGLVNLRADKSTKHNAGIVTSPQNRNAITTHIQIQQSRGSSLPQAVFCSNDNGIRILDVNTNRFIAEHKYTAAVNCSAISPDQRLRVVVGDIDKVMICNAETGEILQELDGHRDFGFACDWADDGWTVATGNQDMQVKIWDARKWKNSAGISIPIKTIAAEMAGVRKLKFSPLGSGKRVLIAAEPADFINVIDAETFSSKQTLSFFGDIGGFDFSNNGQDLIVANCDHMRGGIMQFERCSFANEGMPADEWEIERRLFRREYDWNDEIVASHPSTRGTATNRARRPAALGRDMAPF